VRGRGIDAEDRLLGFGGNPLVEDKPAFLLFGGRGKDFLLAQEGRYVGIRPCDRADDPLEGRISHDRLFLIATIGTDPAGEAPNQSKSALTETLQLDTADPSALTVRVAPAAVASVRVLPSLGPPFSFLALEYSPRLSTANVMLRTGSAFHRED
jgi:hypothetical protein